MNIKIRKILSVICLFLILGLFIPSNAYAMHGPLDNLEVGMNVSSGGQSSDYKDSFNLSLGNFTENDANLDKDSFFNKIFGTGRGVLFGMFGVATLTFVILFIINFVKLGAAADNPSQRSEALKGLLHTGIALALLGGITIIVGVTTGLFT